MQTQDSYGSLDLVPDFSPGDEVMHVDPSGRIPWPMGPYVVIGCVQLEIDFSLYVVSCPVHGQHLLEGVEMLGIDEWHRTFSAGAN